jgi:beta-glucosidase
MSTTSFPEGFLWGAATAAHQVEGSNWNSDWWEFEHQAGSGCAEPSGDACDSWSRWPEDLDLVASLGLGAYRFSMEWARIEPEEGEYSVAALDHYRRVLAGCHDRGLVPMVTMNHFTLPRWLARRGGWEWDQAPERFARYCRRTIAHLGDLMSWVCTVNEPNIVAVMGYRFGIFPPAVSDGARRDLVQSALIRAHHAGRDAIKAAGDHLRVGLTLSMTDYQALPGGEEKLEQIRARMEDGFLAAARRDDFLGVQTYSRARVGPLGTLGPEEGVAVTQMGYEYWPQALEGTLRRAAEVLGGVPLLVTENGISTDDDSERVEFIASALRGISRCLADGIDVRGYVYWSLMDNFEWVLGYGPKFGLVAVDRSSFDRRPKPSAAWLGAVARANALGTQATPAPR